jgi:broad specificity phosphatase PhoE
MRSRAVAVLNEIASTNPQQTTVVVSHGGLVNLAISTLTAQRSALPHIGNCSISVLRREANGTWVADVIGDSDHVQRGLRDESNVDAPAVR